MAPIALGLGLNLATLSTGVGVTPATQANVIALFGATAGFFFDPSDLTTLFQDSAGTTPVTVDGNPVGLIRDLSPNAYHKSQATSAARPLWKLSSGLAKLLYQGTDDYMRRATTKLPLGSDWTYFDVIEETSSVNGAGVFTVEPATGNDYANNDGLSVVTASSPLNYACSGTVSTTFDMTVTGSKPSALAVREVVKQGTTGNLYVNGVLAATDNSFTAFDALSAGGFTTGRRFISGSGAGPYFIGREYMSFFIGRALTAAERTLVRTYAAAKGGITL